MNSIIISSCSKLTDIIKLLICYISLPSSCALFRASSQSLIGRVARYTPSSDFGMQLQNSTQYDGNYNMMAINLEHLLK
ncbi:unknown [Prevotella sp. CAG:487]|nr:unknown [Prevotella sp. CAG:487]